MFALTLIAAAGMTQSAPVVAPSSPRPALRLAVFRPGEARCGGAVVDPVRSERPLPAELSYYPSEQPVKQTLRLNFRIDAAGRPLSISQPSPTSPTFSLAGPARDLIPAFSIWRFAPGAARENCEVTFGAEVTPAASAPIPEIHRHLILGRASRQLRRAIFDRIAGPGSTCFNPGPNVRQRVYPAFERIEQPPGTASYSLVAFDIDAAGRPTNVRLADSSENAELDRQSLDAIRRSRFAPEAKQGCTYPYWRRATEQTPPPPVPETRAFRRPGDTCSPDGTKWAQLPQLVFPPEFIPRGVEGWAIVRYDIAPWGATGNISVVAAEPAARFGTQAEMILRNARGEPSSTGATGCVDRVIFRLPEPGERSPSASDAD